MADEKKLDKEITENELTDKELDKATGGKAGGYTCSACNHFYYGAPFISGGKPYCANCVPKNTLL